MGSKWPKIRALKVFQKILSYFFLDLLLKFMLLPLHLHKFYIWEHSGEFFSIRVSSHLTFTICRAEGEGKGLF